MFQYDAVDEAATERLGIEVANVVPRPAVVALCGTLGAGKTRLVRAIARGLGIDPESVTSPTFVLLHEYPGTTPLFHFDAYRLRDEDEFWQLGADEYLSGQAGGVVVIEWADRVAGCLPDERLDITIEVVGPTERRFSIAAHGDRYEASLRQLIRRYGGS
ncbi:MAG TPA: tRNA (adenosine(37)-N6)-threonylcarbamoyltransferase complex ATPase subunit type 1 TsaE [Pirellulales bacterium]|nr:tRNA (adenosine(37)-N6)-threonylcarbamoyltransferase complex ATPase subunit type 1 TsaE [Pirellulales bacterium]